MSRLIKKYKNRRLYDTEKSQYITVEELLQYVVDGIAFHVQDSTTNADITSSTLLQIFVEMEATPTPFLSPEMLRQMIILAHHPMNQSFKNMLSQFFASMEKFTPAAAPYLQPSTTVWQEQMQDFIKQWQGFFKS